MEKSLYSERGKSIAFTGHRIIPLVRQEEVKARLTAAVAFACGMDNPFLLWYGIGT